MFTDTIAAISTPLADGAISIVRLSGEDAIQIAEKVFSRPLADKKSHTITYGSILENGKEIDEVLVSLFRAPRTYTREDVVEINCHGGIFITRKILQLLLEAGARLAAPGEFTQRAFYHGRIDLSQAEAVNDMIEASSSDAAKLAMGGIKGSVKKLLAPLIEDILNIIAQIEVNIDYPEYDDVEELTFHQLLPETEKWLQQLDQILQKASIGQLVKKGLNTVIIGQPNVGKSSLLNALLEEDKAIVTAIPGTTRDIVEGQIHIGRTQLNLIDTAGIRHSEDAIEQIGIEKSRQKLEQADLVLLVLDGSREPDEKDRELMDLIKDKKHLIVYNKADISRKTDQKGIWISAASGRIENLVSAIEALYKDEIQTISPVLSNERQIGLLKRARESMMKAKQAMEMETEPDLIEIDIQEAYTCLKEILGEVHREDLLDTLFSKFCLGK